MIVPGMVQGFDRVSAPRSAWRAGGPGAAPVGATGISGATSLFNLQERVPMPVGIGGGVNNLQQNVVVRSMVGWATNPLDTVRPATYAGNGFNRGSAT